MSRVNESKFTLIYWFKKNQYRTCIEQQEKQERPGNRCIINSAHLCFCHSQHGSGHCQLSLWRAAGKYTTLSEEAKQMAGACQDA